jgi:hypothetical protein
MQRLRAAEDEANSLTNQVDALSEESASSKKAVRDSERKLALAVQSKDAEIVRLTRRNEVLGEAVTRLTSSSSSASSTSSQGGSVGGSGSKAPLGKFFTAGVSASPGDDNVSHLTTGGSGVCSPAASASSNADEGGSTYQPRALNFPVSPVRPSHSAPANRSDATSVHGSRPATADRVGAGAAVQGLVSPLVSPEGAIAGNHGFPTPPHTPQQQQEGGGPAPSSSDTDLAALVREAVLAASTPDPSLHPKPAEEEAAPLLTPPSAPASHTPEAGDSGGSGGSSGSGSLRFKEKLQAEVVVGRDMQLPYSPTRVRNVTSAPVHRSPPPGKENLKQSKIPSGNKGGSAMGASSAKPGAGDRIKRASEFIKNRQAHSQSARARRENESRKGPVF